MVGAAVQSVKLLFEAPTSLTGMPDGSATLLLTQLSEMCIQEAADDSSSIWVLAIQVRGLYGIPGSQLQPHSSLASVGIGRVNQCTEDTCHSA